MRIDGKLIAFIFDLDNWAKDKMVNDLNYPAVKEEKDVIYNPDYPQICKADLFYNPYSSKYPKYPVIINVHGGGWVIGDKRNSRGQCLQMADSGWFVVNINYGLPPKEYKIFEKHNPAASHGEHYYPFQIANVYQAMEWVAANAKEYNLDPECVIVSGDSAGSHIAGVTAASYANADYRKALGLPDPAVKLKGAILFSGFYDPYKFYGTDALKIPVFGELPRALFGTRHPENDPMYKYFNPIPYITKDIPKCLVVNGNKDPITYGQSRLFKDKLEEVGADHEFYEETGLLALHDFHLLAFLPNSHKCMQYVAGFLDRTAPVK
jgi:acetyl esterase/lipase